MSEVLKRVVVLVSGGGTNLQSLIDKVHKNSCEIVAVFSDNPKAYGLERAKNAGIYSEAISYRSFEDEKDFFAELYSKLDGLDPDLIVLAGFLKILTPEFYSRFENKIMNIHPSLIPSFCGKGFYGIRVHQAVLEYGAKISGVTVHFADDGADTGPIILQRSVIVEDSDTPESLQAKILVHEHEILPQAVELFCKDKLYMEGRRVKIRQ
ncbi:MAG: phosphoribosylglycinamide formyltransferase [Anaerofustis stercorihominis]|nr:phosphoribosylglycinamide formyltransferase [Anaerofustis stercorihominis]